MSKISPSEVTSYAGGAVAIGTSLTLTQVGVIVGIATALITFIFNMVYMYRKDQREQRHLEAEQRLIDAELAKLAGRKKTTMVPAP